MELDEYLSKYDKDGNEIMDSTPVAASLRIRPVSEYRRLTQMIRYEMSQAAAKSGFETLQESEDFDVGDDFDPTTPFEEQFDPNTGESQWNQQFFQEAPIKAAEDRKKAVKGGDGGQGPHVDPDPPAD